MPGDFLNALEREFGDAESLGFALKCWMNEIFFQKKGRQ